MTNADAAMAKLFCSEMAGRVTDHAIQILGGMGLMDELPLEMLWRDAASSASGTAPARSSATSSPVSCCGLMRHERKPQVGY